MYDSLHSIWISVNSWQSALWISQNFIDVDVQLNTLDKTRMISEGKDDWQAISDEVPHDIRLRKADIQNTKHHTPSAST